MKNQKSGQAVLEYILLLSIVLGILVLGLKQLRGALDKMTLSVGANAEKNLRTGSGDPGLWKK